MEKKKKSKKRGIKKYILPAIIVIIMLIGIGFCLLNVNPISKESEKVRLNITEGSGLRDIVHVLKEKNLIRNEKFMLVYVKLNKVNDLKAGDFVLNKSMKPKEIFEILKKGSNVTSDEITITFHEGKTMRVIAKTIEKNTANSYDDVFKVLADKKYINSLINKYWFLTDEVLNENIYYPLEGYLAPDTYKFKENVTVKEIFEKLLDQTDTILTKYKAEIQEKNLTVHKVLTLASMVESEGVSLEDRKNIAGVFMNRLNANMSLGSDVTTYYAFKIELGERDLYTKEINSSNPYNTRSAANAGKLPVGPICNPSKDAIVAALEYTPNDYYYFVADKNMKVYFTKTASEHSKIISELKSKSLWYEY